MTRTAALLPVMVFALSACTFGVPIGDRGQPQTAGAPRTERSANGNPSSYVVHGRRYYVMDNSAGFVERGVASWYGIKFHGRRTSSGEVYDMHAMTAAHKTLPLPTYVHVRNLDNGRTAIVKVNDRGPFIEGRIIDLSYAAAKKLGVKGPGTARVEISVLAPGQSQPVSVARAMPLDDDPAMDVPLFVQMGSFSSHVNASNLVQELVDANELSASISRLRTASGLFYRVRVGPLYDIDEANAIVDRLRQKGFMTARIVVHDENQ